MKKISVLAVLTLIFLTLLTGCRSTEPVTETAISQPTYRKTVFTPEVKEEKVSPVVQESFVPSVSSVVGEVKEEVPEVEEAVHTELPALEIVVVDNSTPVEEQSVQQEVEVTVTEKTDNAGLVILGIVAAIALACLAYYYFIFRKKVSKKIQRAKYD